MKNEYDVLGEQIGDMGGEKPQTKKLRNKSSYGQKEDLTPEEKENMDAFLNRSRTHNNEDNETPILEGWIPIDRTEMGIRSLFYPEAWEFFVRPATVQAIKNWTAVDEERPDMLNKVFNEIVKTCVKIDTHDSTGAGWTQLKSWDRFWFILKIREYTFSNKDSKIEFTDVCSECDEEIQYNLTADSLFYEFPDDDLIEKYWDNGAWTIDPQEYDVNHDIITLYTPTLGKDEAIIEWATNKVRNKQKLDETFIKFLVWLLPKPSRDPQMLDRQIQKIYKDYKEWDIDMFKFMDDVINNITINASEKLRVKCPHCSQEATSTVQFPNGVKILFEVKSNNKKFGSR